MARRQHRDTLRIGAEEFEALVQQAVQTVPAPYKAYLENVSVVVEQEPSAEVLDDLEMDPDDDLLGLYTGTAVGEESFFDPAGRLPARIEIYRGPILRLCRSKEEVIREVRDTVVHEIGHHFGLSDEDMPY